ncbi:MAG: hypothetical protein PVH40_06875 [Gemmatimonadales bacterium]|jgi:hypothetical protein
MDVNEHFYTDDPSVGHPDVRTRLLDVDYFFLGNGHIQAAVQVCNSGEGTPLGLLVLNPDDFGPKRAALTCDPERGLEDTVVTVRVGDHGYRPDPSDLNVRWDTIEGIPAVLVAWQAGPVTVVEGFYCPDHKAPRLCRRIDVQLASSATDEVTLLADRAESYRERSLGRLGSGPTAATLVYEIVRRDDAPSVRVRWQHVGSASTRTTRYWTGLTQCRTDDPELDHVFSAARNQLPVAVDFRGRMDGSIWQYNLEWVRDQAHVAEALVMLGDRGLARTMLARLLDTFVSSSGDTVDSGRRRPPAEVELDQNGVLLNALRTYVDWTGELGIVADHWDKVRALAHFPLRDEFRHQPSGLLHNRREYWERHAVHGIEDGMELMHQFWVVVGLRAAAYLAGLVKRSESQDWALEAKRLEEALLEHERYRMIENGHLIKRRTIDGEWQRAVKVSAESGLPPDIPLMDDGEHLLDPDTSCALPIAHALVDPQSGLAHRTLEHIEELWDQRWEGGGYGRYHVSSEADSPGPWPFPSLFVARAYAEVGDHSRVERVLRWLATKPGGRAGTWFEFDGWKPSPPCPQAGITPWTWAEIVMLYVHHLLGVRPDAHGLTVRPQLLPTVDSMKASILVRRRRLELTVHRAATPDERKGIVGSRTVPWTEAGVRLPLPDSDLTLEILC